MKQNLKKHLPQGVLYLSLLYLFMRLGEGYRLSKGGDFIDKSISGVFVLGTISTNPIPSFHPFDFLFGLIGTFGIAMFVHFKRKNAKTYRHKEEYGSARFGKEADIKPFVDPKFENNMILTATEKLTMNSRPKDPKFARNKNALIVGGSGSGKTRFWFTPNLLQMHSSYVVTDPKAGILADCGNALLKNNYRLKVFNTINFKKSMHYNPFAYLHSEQDILKLVNVLISNTKGDGKSSDEFWNKAETLLYCALIGYLHYEAPKEEQNMNTLVELIASMEVREDDETFKNPVDYMFEALEAIDPEHFAVRQYRKFKLAAGKTLKSILISCGARLAVFDIAEVREIMSYDELELDTLGDEKTALFFIISDTDSSLNFLIAMAFTQMFDLLCKKADDHYGGRLPVHVRCLWDEAANTGQVPQLEKICSVIRSREISMCLGLQAQSQLKALYKENAETIIGNMDSRIFLGGAESSTLKEWSAMLGKQSIDTYNTNDTRGTSRSYGVNYQKLGRELLTPDELMAMDGAKCILQLRGVRPFFSDKYDLKKHPRYKLTADYDKRNTFDIEKFLSTRLKIKKNEVFQVYEFSENEL